MPDIYNGTKTNTKEKPEIKNINPVKNEEQVKNSEPLTAKTKEDKEPIGDFLSSFSFYPRGVHFETQDEKEEIVMLLRRHIVTNFLWIFIAFIMAVFPIFFSISSKFFIPFHIPVNFQIVFLLIWYTLVFSVIFINFLVWYFNVYILTNKRIVDVDFYNLVYKKISSAQLNKVQDVTIKSYGLLRIIFDFADIFIQTAGTEPNFDFVAVPKPDVVARKINELVERNKNI